MTNSRILAAAAALALVAFAQKASAIGYDLNASRIVYSADKVYNSQPGFEETALGHGLSFTPVPEPSALLPLIGVLGVVVATPFVRRAFRV